MVQFWVPALFLGVFAVVGLVVFVIGARELYYALRIYRGDPSPIADVANRPGLVEIQGTARIEDGTVESPFSGTDCLICEWEVQERRHSSNQHGTNSYWKTLDEGLMGGPFRLEDDTASCLVKPAGSDRHLEEQSVRVPGGTTPPQRIQEFIASNPEVDAQDGALDLVIAELNLGNDQRYVERRLDPGEDCYVYGRAHYDSTAGSRAGEVNVVVDGEGARRFIIADTREGGLAWSLAKRGLFAVAIGLLFGGFALAMLSTIVL